MARETIRWTGPTPADPFRGVDAGPGAGPDEPAARKRLHCKPGRHRWVTPAPGDETLRCEHCPRALALGDIDAFHRGGMVRSMTRQLGPDGGAAFEAALDAAIRAARGGA